MREVLVDFVVPRFRTEAQIKVIRSNTFLTDLRGSDDDLNGPVNKTNYDDEIKQLRLKLEETLDEKVEIVKGSLNGVTKLEESSTLLFAVSFMILHLSLCTNLNFNTNT